MKREFVDISVLSLSLAGLIALWPTPSLGAPPEVSVNRKFACASQLYQTIGKWEPAQNWRTDSFTPDHLLILRASTEKADVNFAVTSSRGYTDLIRRTPLAVEAIRWREDEGCVPHLQLVTRDLHKKEAAFTDWDLAELLDHSFEKKQAGLIYVWSPHMNLSVKGYHEAEKVAQDKHIDFTPMLDPNAAMDMAKKVAHANHIPDVALRRFAADSLYHRNMIEHYPSFVVYRNGVIPGNARMGYDVPQALSNFVNSSLNSGAVTPPDGPSGLRHPASNEPPLSDDIKKICTATGPTLVKRLFVPKDEIPNYFHRVLSKAGWVAFSNGWGDEDSEHQIVLLNLANGSTKLGPGPYDLVPLVDEELVTQPHPFHFYKTSDVLKHGADTQILYDDVDMAGYYQSTGLLSTNGSVNTHRILMDDTRDSTVDGLVLRDFKIKSPTKSAKDIKTASREMYACEGKLMKLPMLSKNGTRVSGIDETGYTKVFEIGIKNDHCKELLNTEAGTGKADFSFDQKMLAFHKAFNGNNSLGWNETPQQNWHQNVFVYNIETGQVKQLTHNTTGNSTYPVFKSDGMVVYADSVPGPSGGIVHSFVVADPSKVPWSESTADLAVDKCVEPKCDQKKMKEHLLSVAVIGGLWDAVCIGAGEVNRNSALLTAMTLNGNDCKTLVQNQWKDYQAKVARETLVTVNNEIKALKGLTVDTLIAACPAVLPVPGPSPIEIGESAEETTTATQIFSNKCSLCHGTGDYKMDFTNLASLYQLKSKTTPSNTLAQEILRRIQPSTAADNRMPLGGQLDDLELKTLANALKDAQPAAAQ